MTAFVASCNKILSVSIDEKVPPGFIFDGSRFAECCNYLQYFAVMEETSEDTHPMFNADPSINHKILSKIEHKDSSKGEIQNLPVITYGKVPNDPNIITTGEPDSTIEFKVEEKLRGGDVPDTIVLNGYLSDKDDFNEMPVPYMFVRRLGRRGSCFANTYREGTQFLLFLKKIKDGFTSNISALGPTNEQLHSDNDEWLIWVRNHLKSFEVRDKESAALCRGMCFGG